MRIVRIVCWGLGGDDDDLYDMRERERNAMSIVIRFNIHQRHTRARKRQRKERHEIIIITDHKNSPYLCAVSNNTVRSDCFWMCVLRHRRLVLIDVQSNCDWK